MAKSPFPLLLALLWLTHQGCTGADQKADSFHDQLTEFFHSPHGLGMSYREAVTMADKEENFLTQCSVTVPMLQSLRDVLVMPSALDLGVSELRQHLLPLAYHHASPDVLAAFYKNLAQPSLGGCSTADAETATLDLATRHAEPALLLPLYQVLVSQVGVGLSPKEALRQAVDLTAAGTDAKQLASAYWDAQKTVSRGAALSAAIKSAVAYHLLGLTQRYAKNGEAYTAKGFQDYYGAEWLKEWQAAPQQKRTASDGKDYLASEFETYYGSKWNQYWAASPEANQVRIATDGKTYTMSEFKQFYGDEWQMKWASAYEVVGSPQPSGAEDLIM